METQLHSEQIPPETEAALTNQQSGKVEDLHIKQETTGIGYHDYTPKHSSHGRLNYRAIGQDHEPGTMK